MYLFLHIHRDHLSGTARTDSRRHISENNFLAGRFCKTFKTRSYKIHFIILITSARRLCNHLGLYVCMCVCL
jgi:hypothetical protein